MSDTCLQKSAQLTRGDYTLVIDVDSKDVLQGMDLKSESGQTPEGFIAWRDGLLGGPIHELPGPLPENNESNWLMLRQLLKEYRGESALICQDLVCRCFAVGRNTIRELMEISPEIDLRGITDECRAGGGCTSCLGDIEAILDEGSSRIDGMTPAAWMICMDDLINEFFQGDERPELSDVDGNNLHFSSSMDFQKMNELKNHLREKSGRKINLLF